MYSWALSKWGISIAVTIRSIDPLWGLDVRLSHNYLVKNRKVKRFMTENPTNTRRTPLT